MGNIKQKDDGMDQNTLHCCYVHSVATDQQNLMNKTRWRDFVSLAISHCFQRLFRTYYLLLHYLNVCQSSLIGNNIRFLTFSFITATLHIPLDKTDINITHLRLHILALTIDFDCPEKY